MPKFVVCRDGESSNGVESWAGDERDVVIYPWDGEDEITMNEQGVWESEDVYLLSISHYDWFQMTSLMLRPGSKCEVEIKASFISEES